MKNLIIVCSFLKKNITPIIIIIITMFFSLFNLISIIGKYNYITYSRDIYKNSGLENAVYFAPAFAFGDKVDDNQIKEGLKSYTAFEKFIVNESKNTGYNNYYINACFYDDSMVESFEQPVTDGEWLHLSSVQQKAEYIEAVIGGMDLIWQNVDVGDIISMNFGEKIYNVKIIGKMKEIGLLTSFGNSGSKFTTDMFFQTNNNFIFLNKNSFNAEDYNNLFAYPSRCFFVEFKDNSTVEERNEVVNYLKRWGTCYTYNEIIQNTNNEIEEQIKEKFPMPVFLLLISTISMICISAVAIQRSMYEHSIYFLIGSSKKKSIVIIIMALISVFCIPVILNLISAIFYPDYLRVEKIGEIDYIINFNCILPVIIYLLVIIGMLITMPITFYNKNSPLSFYRRNI